MLLLFAGMVGVSTIRRFWSRRLVTAWIVVAPVLFLLMKGGLPGMPEVSTRPWGGLTVTVFVAVFGLATGYPIAILLALGRRSPRRSLRWPCIAVIDCVRGVPLISLIFMAAVMTPLFLPQGIEIDRLFRVQLAFTLFSAAYLAEVIRGGLAGLEPGQEEAAKPLGLGYWQRIRLVVLPQVLKTTIPSQVNTFIILFKDTTLVVIVGSTPPPSTSFSALRCRATASISSGCCARSGRARPTPERRLSLLAPAFRAGLRPGSPCRPESSGRGQPPDPDTLPTEAAVDQTVGAGGDGRQIAREKLASGPDERS